MKTVRFYTLGCKVNLYETEAMRSLFEREGFLPVDSDNADVYIINTCTVTATGDKKSRQIIRRAKRNNPGSIVAVVGCYAQVSPEEVRKIPDVDIIAGTADKSRIVEYVKSFSGKRIDSTGEKAVWEYEDIPSDAQNRARAMLKVQDGCDKFCSYCIIPYARGPVRSRPVESAVREAEALAKKGFTEIVMVGIRLCSYGKDTDVPLTRIIKAVSGVEGIKRVRLGSLSPESVTPDFVRELSEIPNICPAFHVSMQSGCDETLRRMNRKYTAEEYLKAIGLLRKFFPDCAISTDVMVGFPGESDGEFNKSLETVEKAKFADLHVFQYSRRKGTPAAGMGNQVSADAKASRSHAMIELGKELKKQYCEKFIGKSMEVLFETKEGDCYEGLTENYIRVRAPGDNLEGQYKRVKLEKYTDEYCIGSINKNN